MDQRQEDFKEAKPRLVLNYEGIALLLTDHRQIVAQYLPTALIKTILWTIC